MADHDQLDAHLSRRAWRQIGAVAAIAALALSACSVSGEGASESTDDGSVRTEAPATTDAPDSAEVPDTTEAPDAPDPDPAGNEEPQGSPAAPGTEASTIEDCVAMASGPWTSAAHSPDPIGDVREGRVPAAPGSPSSQEPDRLSEFATLDDYRDTSTFTNPRTVYAAWKDAGFEEGIEARWGSGNNFAAITVVRFADAANAQDALTAHLVDYCQRAVHATVRDDGAGLTIQRSSGAMRTLFVMDDVEVSVFVCACFGDSSEERAEILEGWADEIKPIFGPANPSS